MTAPFPLTGNMEAVAVVATTRTLAGAAASELVVAQTLSQPIVAPPATLPWRLNTKILTLRAPTFHPATPATLSRMVVSTSGMPSTFANKSLDVADAGKSMDSGSAVEQKSC